MTKEQVYYALNFDKKLAEVVVLGGETCMAIRGTAPVEERVGLFNRIYLGCEMVSKKMNERK